jgi:hypothetical protein
MDDRPDGQLQVFATDPALDPGGDDLDRHLRARGLEEWADRRLWALGGAEEIAVTSGMAEELEDEVPMLLAKAEDETLMKAMTILETVAHRIAIHALTTK